MSEQNSFEGGHIDDQRIHLLASECADVLSQEERKQLRKIKSYDVAIDFITIVASREGLDAFEYLAEHGIQLESEQESNL